MMTVYGRKITQNDMDAIAIHMDDEIREQVHFQLAPCTPDEFLAAYLEKDPDFEEILKSEFGWKEDDDMTADDNQESTDNERVISEWQEAGGVLGYDTDRNGKTSLYIMDDGEFSDRCKEFTEDEDAVAKLLCESALRNAGISEEKIDQLMNWE